MIVTGVTNLANIPCVLPCVHQKDGLCGLNTASTVTCDSGICPHFSEIENNLLNSGVKSLSECSDTNNLN